MSAGKGLGTLLRESMAEQLPNAFPEVTPDERVKINGEQLAKQKEYFERVNAPIVFQEFTAEELFEKIASNPSITIDENNRRAIKILCLYFTNDIRFEEMGGSLKKGLMLRGGIGIGKTFLMNIFRINQKQVFSIKNCGEIASQFNLQGREILETYTTIKSTVPSSNNFGQDQSGICFDDLGCEKDGIHYADKVEILAPIIEMRYTRNLHALTHITTNLPPEEIDRRYGERVRSRMREMFNVIDFPLTATDRRK